MPHFRIKCLQISCPFTFCEEQIDAVLAEVVSADVDEQLHVWVSVERGLALGARLVVVVHLGGREGDLEGAGGRDRLERRCLDFDGDQAIKEVNRKRKAGTRGRYERRR